MISAALVVGSLLYVVSIRAVAFGLVAASCNVMTASCMRHVMRDKGLPTGWGHRLFLLYDEATGFMYCMTRPQALSIVSLCCSLSPSLSVVMDICCCRVSLLSQVPSPSPSPPQFYPLHVRVSAVHAVESHSSEDGRDDLPRGSPLPGPCPT